MPFVQHVYAVQSPQEFIELVTMCDYMVSIQDDEAIVKSTSNSKVDIRPPVKGLIFRMDTGEIIAPAIYAPMDVATSADVPPLAIGYSMVLDGILIRFYRYGDSVRWSTSGMIHPAEGRWGAGKTFHQMYEDCASQVNLTAIKPELCYYAIMEHSDHMSFYRPSEQYALLTLVRVTDLAGVTQDPRELTNHRDAFANILEIKDDVALNLNLNTFDQDLPPGPVTYDTFGIMAHYEGGAMVRLLSLQARKAMSMAPNMPYVWQHWINCVWQGGYPIIDLYLQFFPWRKPEFDRYTTKLRQQYGHDLRTVTKKALRELIGYTLIEFNTPAIDTSVPVAMETPVIETPAMETHVIETPVIETPAIETPAIDTPVPVAIDTPVPVAIDTPVPVVIESVIRQRPGNLADLKENCHLS